MGHILLFLWVASTGLTPDLFGVRVPGLDELSSHQALKEEGTGGLKPWMAGMRSQVPNPSRGSSGSAAPALEATARPGPRAKCVPCPWDLPSVVFNHRAEDRISESWVPLDKVMSRGDRDMLGALTAPSMGLLSKTAAFNPNPAPWGTSSCLSCTSPFSCQQLRALGVHTVLSDTSALFALLPGSPRVRNSPAAGGSQDTEINLLDSIITTAAAATANL